MMPGVVLAGGARALERPETLEGCAEGPGELLHDRTWFCIRRNGTARRAGWIRDVSLALLRREVGAEPEETVEVCIAGNFRHVPVRGFEQVLYPRARGLTGIEMTFGGKVSRLSPTRMLAANLGFRRALERFLEEHGVDRAIFAREGGLRAFDAEQYLLPPGGRGGPIRLFRGATLVEETAGSLDDRATALVDGTGGWMLRNLSDDGGLPYKYWPSRGEDSPADNAIRRFLATIALARMGKFRDSPGIRDAARRNLRFNLARYFQPLGDGRGAIVERSHAKLGAAALAGLAIVESEATQEFAGELTMLAAGVESLVDDRLGFRTFFFPAERDGENWNFYSGEALLFWAEAARRGLAVAPSLERCGTAFELCRKRHRRQRNPAFVPWHTQACVSLFVQTGERRYADFVLEMNDWLQAMQQWDGVEADLRGRFHDPDRPEFGPPHASSTGVYLEGYVDAAALARALGDARRAAIYERIVRRGLRALRQLQFRDRRDMFYISRPERVLGALRTTVYDNAVRVDSAAHALLAGIKVLRQAQGPA